MARDVERQRRRFKEHTKDRVRKMVPEEPPKPLNSPPKAPLQTQPPQPPHYTAYEPSLDEFPIEGSPRLVPKKKSSRMYEKICERNRTVDKPTKNLPESAPQKTQTQKVLFDVNDVIKAISRKPTPRRARKKLGAAQDLIAAVKKSREELKINHAQINQISSDNSSSGQSVQSSDTKSTLTSTKILTPKKAAMIDAVKKNRRNRVYLPSDHVNQITNVQPEKVASFQPVEITYAWPEQFDSPRKVKVDNILTRTVNKSRFEKEVDLQSKQATYLRPPTLPSRKFLPTLSPSPLRERLAIAKSNGKSKKSNLLCRRAVTKSASVSNLPKPIKKVYSDRSLSVSKNSNRPASLDTRYKSENDDDESMVPLEWESSYWQKQQGRIQERLSSRFHVKVSVSPSKISPVPE